MGHGMKEIELFFPNNFEYSKHFYPKAQNAQLHPMVGHFFSLSNERIIDRYYHLNPQVDPHFLLETLNSKSKYFYWGGADLFYVTTAMGNRKMVVLETNSCPSGQKSMPSILDSDEHRSYRTLIEDSFLPSLKGKRLIDGEYAVIYDKNYMEASGYAQTLSDITEKKVYLIPFFDDNQCGYFDNGVLYVDDPQEGKIPIKAALRYVTQAPWKRIPVQSKTFIYNSPLVCLSGGRNKLVANKAYDLYNADLSKHGLQINTPETIKDVSKVEIPLWVQKLGGHAVVKVPYSNAGQGVFTITSERELEEFMNQEFEYDQFIVQSLIGHYNWSSKGEKGRYYHVGTLPNKKGKTYVADLRVMAISTQNGFRPIAIYARKARAPLEPIISEEISSWDMLGTNLSIKKDKNVWESDTNRLLLMDRKDFNTLGMGIDDLISGFIQTVLSILAIDKMAGQLISKKGSFRMKLFNSLNNDEKLVQEILIK